MIQEMQPPLAAPQAPRLRPNGLGTASFILSLIAWGLLILSFFGMALIWAGQGQADGPAAVLGCSFLMGGLCALVGTGLGIAGCCLRDRKKGLAIAGLILSAVYIFGTLALMGIGLMVADV